MNARHTITTDDGDRLVAVHHEPATQSADAWLVFCHGFVSDKSGSYEERCRRVAAEGYPAVRFDFRGCGESDGEFVDQTLSSKIEDLRAVLDYFAAPEYVLFGSSFGAKTAFHAAVGETHPIRAIVGRAPLTYGRALDDLRTRVERDGEYTYDADHVVDSRFVADLDRYSFADVAAGLDVPVALFHGTDDESVPAADTLDAARALDVDVLVQLFAGEGHRFSPAAESRLRTQFLDWLAVTRDG
ncbi:MAG: alpha/beta hydrolase family protein [Haloferacaceae archaeon]